MVLYVRLNYMKNISELFLIFYRYMKCAWRLYVSNFMMMKSFSAGLSIICLLAYNNADAADAKMANAEKLFEMRCKNAGERIARTVDEVEGIYLLKLRTSKNFDEQFAMNDPYGNDLINDGYIQTFLREHYQLMEIQRQRYPALARKSKPNTHIGYAYVEAVNPADGKRYRYTGRIEQPGLTKPEYSRDYLEFVLDFTPSSNPLPRYGVTFDDISTHEDRLHWIAGSSLKVIDLKENKIIAERIGYMLDRGQGSTNGGRSPWLMAARNSCPQFLLPSAATHQLSQTDRFVEKVLRPAR